jgi:hypothetical protein
MSISVSITPASSALGSSIESAEITDGTIVGADLNDSVVNDLTTVSVASGDYLALADVSDSNKKKKGLVSDITALAVADSSIVKTSGDQTVAGVKTFSSAPVMSGASISSGTIPEASVSGLVSDLAAKADDSGVVHNTGTESVSGAKTFTDNPTISGTAPSLLFVDSTPDVKNFRINVNDDIVDLRDNDAASGSLLALDIANNRVGIGKNNPATALDVSGTVTATAFAGPLTGNVTGNASTVTTNANLTGPITSVGNATSIAAQTGTGTTFVVNTSPTLVTPVLGVATATSVNKWTLTAPSTAATLTAGADSLTYTMPIVTCKIPSEHMQQNSKSAAYTTVLADAGGHILHPTADNNARTFTIDSNANVAYPIGTAITFVNQINTVTIAITSDTMTLAGAGTTGSRTLAASGIATALKIASTSWIISGTGLT